MSALTPARRRALDVLAATHPRPGRYSNVTAEAVPVERPMALVYWQSADWLVDQGLVECTTAIADAAKLRLTDAGVAACAENGIEVRR